MFSFTPPYATLLGQRSSGRIIKTFTWILFFPDITYYSKHPHPQKMPS
jgi:hypothetical protein